MGLKTIHTFENDTGPDDANHAEDGLFILAGPGVPPGKRWNGLKLIDVAPTVLRLFGIPVPSDVQGTVFSDEVLGTRLGASF